MTTPRDPVEDLRSIAFCLERALEPSYRVRAFRTAAATVAATPAGELADRARAGTLTELAGIGKVTATVTVTAKDGPTDEAATSTWLVPWPSLLVLLALIAAAIWLVRRYRGTGGRRVATAEEAPQLTVSGRS